MGHSEQAPTSCGWNWHLVDDALVGACSRWPSNCTYTGWNSTRYHSLADNPFACQIICMWIRSWRGKNPKWTWMLSGLQADWWQQNLWDQSQLNGQSGYSFWQNTGSPSFQMKGTWKFLNSTCVTHCRETLAFYSTPREIFTVSAGQLIKHNFSSAKGVVGISFFGTFCLFFSFPHHTWWVFHGKKLKNNNFMTVVL